LKASYGRYQTFIVIPKDNPIKKRGVRMTARAGSAIIWNQKTMHGSKPNNSENIRYAQFFKMFPSTPMDPKRKSAREKAVLAKVTTVARDLIPIQESSSTTTTSTSLTTFSPIGVCVLGVKPWSDK